MLNPHSAPAQPAAGSPRRFRSLLAPLAAACLLLPVAACEMNVESDDEVAEAPAAGDDAAATDDAETADDDYVDRMAREHAGEQPLPAFAGDQERYADVQVTSEEVVYATVGGATGSEKQVRGYLAMPEGTDGADVALPGLIVIHEWWGLNDNVETMARLFAHHGYAALAVDLYEGEAADSAERARELTSSVDEAAATDNLAQAAAYLRDEVGVSRLGVIGWCFGGGWSLRAALAMPEEIDATVVYYGRLVEDRAELEKLDMPLLGIFGAEDQGIPVEGVREFEATLEDLGKDAEIHVYDGAGHAFANPSGERYQPEAAKQAWEETIVFLDGELKR